MSNNLTSEEKRERLRFLRLDTLNNPNILNLYLAGITENDPNYGGNCKNATKNMAINALRARDSKVGELASRLISNNLEDSLKNGEDPFESGQGVTPRDLLMNSVPFYQEAIEGVKVSDMLRMLGVTEVSEDKITGEQRNMYMSDYKDTNQEMYSELKGNYIKYIEFTGIGSAMAQEGESMKNTLRKYLSQDDISEESTVAA